MKETIMKNLKRLERENDIKVILAVESGSRSWGIPSEGSDYDVRFVYVHRLEWYLSIDEKRDTIELPINESLDLNGWELRKSLQLLRKSNPHLLEWLHSGIIYTKRTTFLEKMKMIDATVFSSKSALYHYLNMAKRNAREYLQGSEIKTKKYFYVLRPILACIWIEKNHTFPPVAFEELVEGTVKNVKLKQEINILVEMKINGIVEDKNIHFPLLKHFLENEMNRIEKVAKNWKDNRADVTSELNVIFREILEEVWA